MTGRALESGVSTRERKPGLPVMVKADFLPGGSHMTTGAELAVGTLVHIIDLMARETIRRHAPIALVGMTCSTLDP